MAKIVAQTLTICVSHGITNIVSVYLLFYSVPELLMTVYRHKCVSVCTSIERNRMTKTARSKTFLPAKAIVGLALTLLLTSLGLLACSSAEPTSTVRPTATPGPTPPARVIEKSPGNLTVYVGRGETLVGPIIEQFETLTGIKVAAKYAGTTELASTLLEEGGRSPADVFFAQDPGGLGAVEDMFTPLPDSILSRVPEWARSPEDKWVGVSGRARTIVYNTEKLTESDLPDDIWDFIDPKWKGRIGWAPTNASFQTMVTAMRVLWGQDKTQQWLEGIQANDPTIYPKNTPQVAAAAAGEIDVGFVNHYYLFRFLSEEGDSFPARNYHPRAGGPGAVIMVAGVGILSTSENPENAKKFLEFMLSQVAQQYFAGQTFEYPLVEGVNTSRLLVPLSEINQPNVDLRDLTDLEGTVKLLRETGVLP